MAMCRYLVADGRHCTEEAGEHDLCHWHDPHHTHQEAHTAEALEQYVRAGGLCHGLQLSRANLAGLNLVNKESDQGFLLEQCNLYRANLRGGHLYGLRMKGGSLMKADLSDANLQCATLDDVNLLGIRWHNTRLDNMQTGKRVMQDRKGRRERAPKQARIWFKEAEETYRDLRKASEAQGIFTMSGNYIQQELTMRRLQLPFWSTQRFTSWVVDLFCGYGEAPMRVVLFSLLLIFICSIFYFFCGLHFQGEHLIYQPGAPLEQNAIFLLECLYYSVVTFTTLGYGDFTPVGLSRIFAAFEAFTGSFTLALFVVVFVKKMTR
ncbi:pentapeptide repeat-containing protein [Aeromonas veronii]|uniref:ion channel n=1 Tax=Aeromonas veronii TaxID=654 RepID=UPI00132A29B3|nr:ion channel [Aeromonas veronii]MXV29317.1 pentapeptide repeat-containing protein [Aeromonas veronii]